MTEIIIRHIIVTALLSLDVTHHPRSENRWLQCHRNYTFSRVRTRCQCFYSESASPNSPQFKTVVNYLPKMFLLSYS